VKFKVAMGAASGACLDRAVVTWSGRSIGRAAGIGFGVVSGVHGSRSLRSGPNIEASLSGRR
jgi:hypothetical protein